MFTYALINFLMHLPYGFSLFFFLFNKFILFIYFWLCWVFVAAHGLSLVVVSRGLLFIAVCGLLIAMTSPVAEHGL